MHIYIFKVRYMISYSFWQAHKAYCLTMAGVVEVEVNRLDHGMEPQEVCGHRSVCSSDQQTT